MKKTKKENNWDWKTIGNNFLFWIVIVVAAVLLMQMITVDGRVQNITFSKYEEIINNKNVSNATITGNTFKGELIDNDFIVLDNGKEVEFNTFTTVLPNGCLLYTSPSPRDRG